MPIHLIRKLEHFTRLSAEDKRELQRAGSERLRRVEPRQDIVVEGDRPEAVNLILDGWACRYRTLEDGRRQIVAFFLPGDMCDLNIFVLREMDHSLGAITPVTVAEITRARMEALVVGHPRVTQALWWDALVSAAIHREWIVNVGQRTATERLGHLMCELFLRLRAVGMADGDSCPLPVTQTELADATGLSPVHVNRTLTALREAGLATVKRRRLTIPDLDALKVASTFSSNYLHFGREGAYLDANE